MHHPDDTFLQTYTTDDESPVFNTGAMQKE